jgi:hypothetical protein
MEWHDLYRDFKAAIAELNTLTAKLESLTEQNNC